MPFSRSSDLRLRVFWASPGPLGSLFESPLEESDWISGADITRAQGRVRVLCSDVTLTSFVLHCLFEWLTRFRRPPEELRASDDRGTHLMGFAPGCGWVDARRPPVRVRPPDPTRPLRYARANSRMRYTLVSRPCARPIEYACANSRMRYTLLRRPPEPTRPLGSARPTRPVR